MVPGTIRSGAWHPSMKCLAPFPKVPSTFAHPLLRRQRECDDVIAARRAGAPVTTRGDHNVLATAPTIRHRCCLTAGRQTAAPEFGAGLNVECPQKIVGGGGDEYQSARCDDGS